MAGIGIERLGAELEKELALYSNEIREEIGSITKQYAKELVKKTKATAPVGNRDSNKYRDSIKSKKLSESPNGVTYAWYVDSKNSNYRLTHLLVHGHAKKGGGRTRGNDFLEKAVAEIEKDYVKAIEEVIKNG